MRVNVTLNNRQLAYSRATSGVMGGAMSRGRPLAEAGAGCCCCCCCLFLFFVRGGEKGAGATASSSVATNAHMLRKTCGSTMSQRTYAVVAKVIPVRRRGKGDRGKNDGWLRRRCERLFEASKNHHRHYIHHRQHQQQHHHGHLQH